MCLIDSAGQDRCDYFINCRTILHFSAETENPLTTLDSVFMLHPSELGFKDGFHRSFNTDISLGLVAILSR